MTHKNEFRQWSSVIRGRSRFASIVGLCIVLVAGCSQEDSGSVQDDVPAGIFAAESSTPAEHDITADVEVPAETNPFDPATRYLIIHADDVGMCRSVNRATIEVLEAGVVMSASIMVPCPAFDDFAAYARQHPEFDYGIHLTLNAEWPEYRWGPVLPVAEVPTLVDRKGLLWRSEDDVAANARADEVERELRAQIDRALEAGIPLSHLDTHMGTLFTRPDFLEIYVRLGFDYGLPVLMPREDDFLRQLGIGEAVKTQKADMIAVLEEHRLPILDSVRMYYQRANVSDKKTAYLNLIRSVPVGVSELLIHCGIGDSELKSIMSNHRIRSGDHAVFTDPDFLESIRNEDVQLITWKQLQQMTSNRAERSQTVVPEP